MTALHRLREVAALATEGGIGERPVLTRDGVESGTGRLVDGWEPATSNEVPAGSSAARPGDVLFGKLRPYLAKSLLVQEPMYISTELLCIRADESALDSRFLLRLIQAQPFLDWANATSEGVKMPRTSWEKLREFRFVLPGLRDQRRVTEFLSRELAEMDAVEAQLHEVRALLGERARVAVSTQTTPEGVAPVRLGRYCDLVTSGPRGWSEYVGAGPTPFFRSANLRRWALQPSDAELVRVDPPKSSLVEGARASTRVGDVLIGITGANTGWVCLCTPDLAGAVVSQHVAIIRPREGVLSGEWLAWSLLGGRAQDQFLAAQYGGTKEQLSLPILRDLRLQIPSFDEQQSAVVRLRSLAQDLTEATAAVDAELELLAERRQVLITEAVTDKLGWKGAAA
jgi:type I restriction enzyme S subunit